MIKNNQILKFILFRKRLLAIKNACGYKNQAQFARKLEITPAALNQLLMGKRRPSIETLITICEKTGCSADYLLNINQG